MARFKIGNPPPALVWTKHGQVIDRSFRSEWVPLRNVSIATIAADRNPSDHPSLSSDSTPAEEDSSGFLELWTVNDLLLPTLQRSDLFSVYTCQATNNNLTVPLSKSVSIELLREH